MTRFDRDPAGALTDAGCIADVGDLAGCGATAEGLAQPRGVAVSADGTSVYVASSLDDAIVRFNRGVSGALSPDGCISDVGDPAGCGVTQQGLAGARGVAVSDDGVSVYVSATNDAAVVSLLRDTTSGALSPQSCIADVGDKAGCGETSQGLAAVRRVVVSPDGLSVYASGYNDGAVAVFDRGADSTAPAVTLKGQRTQKSSKLVKVKVRSDEDAVARALRTIKIPLLARGRAAGSAGTKKLKLKGSSRALVAGQAKTLKPKLAPKARKLTRRAQRKRRRVKAKVSVEVVDGAGNSSSAKRTVTLKGRRR